MAEVTGPIRTLPGHSHDLPDGQVCDLHPDRAAIARIQGETDSFGAELNDMCRACLDDHRAFMRSGDTSGRCDWCRKEKPRLRSRRDYEEGFYGPVYSVCDDCIARQERRDLEALDDYG